MTIRARLREFWPKYLAMHTDPTCRTMHFVGTSVALVVGFSTAFPAFIYWMLELSSFEASMRFVLWLIGSLAIAYTGAWIGHFVYERNTPATFDHPFLSFACDLRMWWLMLRGKM